MTAIELAERRIVPDSLVRMGIRRMLAGKLRELRREDPADEQAEKTRFVRELASGGVALATDLANEQHYEVPPAFFDLVLGAHRKYSSAYWPAGTNTLDEAEPAMLALTCERAGIEDGMRILDLGCGWGSLSLFMAAQYPTARIHAVSNSKLQREYILARVAERGLDNVEVTTADMNVFDAPGPFDRAVSIEMFEHMRNWPLLLSRLERWLAPDGLALLHVFCHRDHVYPYETEGEGNWMGRYFFTGGIMPSEDLILHFQQHMQVVERWRVSGLHYHKTCEAWLENLDRNQDDALRIMAETYGADDADRWLARWRIFFMACSELFAFHGGREWFVSHVRLAPNRKAAT